MVFQGGGALGAYQGGIYEALHEAGIEPDWLAGVSIGAINSAIIAGNPPEKRLEKLKAFWDRITDRKIPFVAPDGDIFREMRNSFSAHMTMMLGQPGFFMPRKVSPLLSFPGAKDATSFYDTAPLRETLLELVDFERINDGAIRLSVGAVNVRSGNFVYFDSRNSRIGPEHVMASGALPPAFPAVQIGTDYFWDGGIVSNTPLQHLLEEDDNKNTLVFQVDLFSARGELPRSMTEVSGRQKDIQYSSRTRMTTDVYKRLLGWKKQTYRLLKNTPDENLTPDDRKMRDELAKLPEITILQMIYQQKHYEGDAKDYEFSGTSMREHWKSGYEDTKRTLNNRRFLEMPPEGTGIVTHDIHRDTEY